MQKAGLIFFSMGAASSSHSIWSFVTPQQMDQFVSMTHPKLVRVLGQIQARQDNASAMVQQGGQSSSSGSTSSQSALLQSWNIPDVQIETVFTAPAATPGAHLALPPPVPRNQMTMMSAPVTTGAQAASAVAGNTQVFGMEHQRQRPPAPPLPARVDQKEVDQQWQAHAQQMQQQMQQQQQEHDQKMQQMQQQLQQQQMQQQLQMQQPPQHLPAPLAYLAQDAARIPIYVQPTQMQQQHQMQQQQQHVQQQQHLQMPPPIAPPLPPGAPPLPPGAPPPPLPPAAAATGPA
jgi:hypothetical protein